MHQVSNEPGVRKYLFDGKPVSFSIAHEIIRQSAPNFESRKFGIWTIREKRTPEVVGFCGLKASTI